MDQQQLKNKVVQIFVNHLNKDANSFDCERSFAENNLDELDIIEAIMRIEDEFSVEISDEEADKFNAVQDIITCVNNKI